MRVSQGNSSQKKPCGDSRPRLSGRAKLDKCSRVLACSARLPHPCRVFCASVGIQGLMPDKDSHGDSTTARCSAVRMRVTRLVKRSSTMCGELPKVIPLKKKPCGDSRPRLSGRAKLDKCSRASSLVLPGCPTLVALLRQGGNSGQMPDKDSHGDLTTAACSALRMGLCGWSSAAP